MTFGKKIYCFVIVFAGLLSVGCNEEIKEEQASMKEAQVQRLRRQIQRLAVDQSAIEEKLVIAQGQIASARAQLDAAEATIRSLQEGVQSQDLSPLQNALSGLTRPMVAPVEKKGWPLPIKLLIVLAILIIVFLFFQRMIADDDEEDLLDDSFVEENDLGTIRYPDQEYSKTEDSPQSESKTEE